MYRDLNPNNNFLDAKSDIKIGDFGLAKFLKLEQLDQDGGDVDVAGSGDDSTGSNSQAGTFYYRAPEIELRKPNIDVKADNFSLGAVFFEFWHSLETASERCCILKNLKDEGELPVEWKNEFSDQATLLQPFDLQLYLNVQLPKNFLSMSY